MKYLTIFFGTLLILWLLFIFWAIPADAMWIVVRARPKVNVVADADIRQAGQSEKGDIIAILPDARWADCDDPNLNMTMLYPQGGPYVVIGISDLTKAQAVKYIRNHLVGDEVTTYRVWQFLSVGR